MGLSQWLNILAHVLIFLKAEGLSVDITYVRSAIAKGAVCLDGSPPAYHFDKGFGAGSSKWLVHHEGGSWCDNVTTCLSRKNTELGSSKYMAKQYDFSGILSDKQDLNPDFYNWNRIKIRYCDGASFTGDVDAVNPAILTGCSSGGLASILHCDTFQALLPAVKLHNRKDISGVRGIEISFSQVVATHGSLKNLPSACTSKMKKPELVIYYFLYECIKYKIYPQTMANVVGDWLYDRDHLFGKIDCPYPCNPTCYND
ncbi:hypothetical protein FEM48_Zijuj05G0132000 [Ziziphus jujuba var. spinosa]|uniref:Pectin acetylesterase n=1 Tax=Ziziphus jujuba var. spinosa TaxID=714518 RepID=A0A978VF11_ZIZJJ|nr:hypothetical protein FEM48_Zijuj05G0132000 [Ziziphus jujuba var. spinosa]